MVPPTSNSIVPNSQVQLLPLTRVALCFAEPLMGLSVWLTSNNSINFVFVHYFKKFVL